MARRGPQPDSRDEDPSDEDLERFGEDAARTVADAVCPDCGARVWSEADVCPKCFAYLGGDAPRARGRGFFRRQWKVLVIVLLIIATLAFAGIELLPGLLGPRR